MALPVSSPPRFIAHYLPQFHPTPENDLWWGKGFTEWTNVSLAKPLFRGHEQPQVPADLGFYDLRVPETRQAQADLAREHGIHGFMYYHYWFHGKRMIERPFEEVLKSGTPDFPFCLCWANETWSKRWLGEDKEILVRQDYSPADFREHARWLARAFADERYIRVAGRPAFVVYRPLYFPKDYDGIALLRDELARAGSDDPFLIAVDVHDPRFDYRAAGYDHTLSFQPALGSLRDAFDDRPFSPRRFLRNLRDHGVPSGKLKLYDYETALAAMERTAAQAATAQIPCVLAAWDNSPRRGDKGIIFRHCDPRSFGKVMERRLGEWARQSPSTDLFFINGWNEWAEGNHLEPDQKFGKGYLEELRRARNRVGALQGWPAVGDRLEERSIPAVTLHESQPAIGKER
jgi:lipopolysaccharide biosynthesis protein